MKQKIINYIKANPHSDGIDIAIGTQIPVETTYELLSELSKKGVIKIHYFGIQTYYEIV